MTRFCIVAPTVLAVDLEKAKSSLRIDGDDMDAMVAGWVAGIIGKLEHEVGQCLMEQTWRVSLDAFPVPACDPQGADVSIALPHPVLNVIAVKYIDLDGVEQTLASDTYRLVRERYSSRLMPARGKSWPHATNESAVVTVDVQCGFGDTPQATPAPLQLYILAKLVEQFDPVSMTQRDLTANTVQARFIEGLLDPFRCHT